LGSGLVPAAQSPGPQDQTQANRDQHRPESRVASVAAHRRSVYEVGALTDENDPDDEGQDAENAKYPAHHRDCLRDPIALGFRPAMGDGLRVDPARRERGDFRGQAREPRA
jgi:hypothetical protein